MDRTYTLDELAFRDEVRPWLVLEVYNTLTLNSLP